MPAEPFAVIFLEGGHKNSLGRANEVYEAVRADVSRMPELYACISDDDAWVRLRAIDTFEKLVRENPALVEPYLDDIFTNLVNHDQPSIQWHIAQIFSEVPLSDKQTKTAIHWLKDKIKTTDIDWIVSGDVMKALIYFCKKGLVSAEELIPLFEVQTGHHSNAISKKATKLLISLSC